jgi:hypothetical protein
MGVGGLIPASSDGMIYDQEPIVLELDKCCSQGYVCDRMLWNAVMEVLSQKDTSLNGVAERFFPGIDISNTSPSLTKFWVIVHSETYFL